MSNGTTLHTAEFLIQPGQPNPLRADAGLLCDSAGIILAIGQAHELRSKSDATVHLQILMPGVVNCHAHLTDAGFAKPVGGGEGLVRWVQGLLASRGTAQPEEIFQQQVRAVLRQMMERGTVAVGEVANNFRTIPAIAETGIRCRFMHELLGFPDNRAHQVMLATLTGQQRAELPSTIFYTLAAHAPYSVSPPLMKLIQQKKQTRAESSGEGASSAAQARPDSADASSDDGTAARRMRIAYTDAAIAGSGLRDQSFSAYA